MFIVEILKCKDQSKMKMVTNFYCYLLFVYVFMGDNLEKISTYNLTFHNPQHNTLHFALNDTNSLRTPVH